MSCSLAVCLICVGKEVWSGAGEEWRGTPHPMGDRMMKGDSPKVVQPSKCPRFSVSYHAAAAAAEIFKTISELHLCPLFRVFFLCSLFFEVN